MGAFYVLGQVFFKIIFLKTCFYGWEANHCSVSPKHLASLLVPVNAASGLVPWFSDWTVNVKNKHIQGSVKEMLDNEFMLINL